ncbi:MAG TPA: acyltransferase family protein [Spirochaetota bacterium]|nr:acyltransferase family protein [Spirochaetota bacterium]
MRNRLIYVDNLRSFVIFLVVVMHSNVIYSGMGRWYYTETNFTDLDVVSRTVFGLFGSFALAWFMGFLFFISGYFAAKSLKKKGNPAFIKERLFRLGIPLLFYVFTINPLMIYFFIKHNGLYLYEFMSFTDFYYDMLKGMSFVEGTGPLWFVEALLIFCVLYVIVRKIFPATKEITKTVPSYRKIILLSVLTAAASFAIRLVCPMGTAYGNLQLGFFASYIVLFFLGTNSAEKKWFEKIVSDKNIIYLKLSFFAGIPAWALLMIFGGALSGDMPIGGGFYWQTAVYALWESFIAFMMTIGLIAFFGKKFHRESRLSRFVSQNSFGVYIFHSPIITGIAILCSGIALPMLAKHFIVFPVSYILSLAVSFVLRKIPYLARITA